MEKTIFLGGGGFAIELYEYMLSDNLNIQGYYAQEDNPELSKFIPWMGDIDVVPEESIDREAEYILAVRSIKFRKKMIGIFEKYQLKAGSFISKKAYFSKFAKLGKGAVVFPNAMVGGDAAAGDYLFMDVMSAISHGDKIGNNVVLGPSAILSGDSVVGDNVTFGTHSAILPGSRIGNNVEISIGTYSRRKISDNKVVFGRPGKTLGVSEESHGL